jgi:putative aldouronate transport system permease protein
VKKIQTRGERISSIVINAIMVVLLLVFVIPFLIVISTSLVGTAEATRRGSFILFPHDPTLRSYRQILGSQSLYRAYGVTLFRVSVGTVLSMLVTGMLAFGLSKHDLPGRNLLITLIFITMIFSAGLIPSFFVIRMMGLYDSIWVMILPMLVNTWNMIILKNFFVTVPKELEESAEIDGASILRRFFQIVVPVSIPAIATISMYYAVSHWNAWFDAAIYINDNSKYPVQVLLRNIVIAGRSDDLGIQMSEAMTAPPAESMKCAVIVVSTLPILCVYPFIQRYFVKGVMVGAVKG